METERDKKEESYTLQKVEIKREMHTREKKRRKDRHKCIDKETRIIGKVCK